MIQLLLNKTTPHFQLLPMSKVDQSYYAFMRRRLCSKRKVKEYTDAFTPLFKSSNFRNEENIIVFIDSIYSLHFSYFDVDIKT